VRAARVVLLIAAGLILPPPAHAQSASDDLDVNRYRGRVIDTSGGRVPGVEVTCKNRKEVVRAATDARGEFSLVSRNGTCTTVEFSLQGFVTETFHSPAADMVLDVSMALGSVGETSGPTPELPGSVLNADGSPAVDASVRLLRLGAERHYGTRTDKEGRFSMPLYEFSGDFVLCARGARNEDGAVCLAFTATEAFRRSAPRLQLQAPAH
jgi:hypothetical protein